MAVGLMSLNILSAYAGDVSQEPCTIPTNIPVSPTEQEWLTIREALQPKLDHCLNNSDYFALYGASLLYSYQIDHAIEMLERALLIDPNNGAAQIDYALALFKSGQLIPALQVNQSILARSDLPQGVREFITERSKLWDKYRYQARTQFTYLYGHSDNLNNATFLKNADDLGLLSSSEAAALETSTDDSSISPPIWELPDDDRAKSGYYNFVGLSSRLYELEESGTSAISLDIKSRVSRYSENDTDQISVSFEQEYERRDLRQTWEMQLDHAQYGNQALYTALDASTGFYSYDPVMTYVTLDARYTYFDINQQLNEATVAVAPGIAIGSLSNRLGAELEYHYNHALKRRAGQDRYRVEARLYWDKSLLGGRFITRLSQSYSQDEEGYNAILKNGAVRDTDTFTATAQYFYPISQQLIVHGSYYYKNQDSNIGYFKTKTENIDLGFTYRF